MRCTFKDKWSTPQHTGPCCSVNRSSPAVWCPKNALLPSKRTAVVPWRGSNYSFMRCKQAACGSLLREMHVTERKERVGGWTRDRVHEEREVARLRQRSLAAVTHEHGQETTKRDNADRNGRDTPACTQCGIWATIFLQNANRNS